MVVEHFYTSDEYIKNNPDWHVDAAPWKANSVLEMMQRNHLAPTTVGEVGCGAGEILKILQQHLSDECGFFGYDIAPQAIELAKTRENEKLHFKLADFEQERNASFDLLLIIDVLEHFEDCFHFLRTIKTRAEYKLFQIPLDIFVLSVLRNELLDFRHATGHLHFYTKDLILEVLQASGYRILDVSYTLPPLEATPWKSIRNNPRKLVIKLLKMAKRGLQRLPGNIVYAFNKDLAVRIFGGWRLMVLTQ